ncbi:MAG: hypothetical protein ABII85_06305 [Bacillota bacterium]
MVNWIKGFKDLFGKDISKLIVTVIALFGVYLTVNTSSGIWILLKTLLPILLIAIAAIGLQFKGKSLAAHLVLILTAYLGTGTAFISTLTSFDFSSMSFGLSFTLDLIVASVIFVYLALFILSHILEGKIVTKFNRTPVVTSAIIAFTYFFFRSGFSVAVLKIAPPVIALLFGSNLFAIMLLLTGVIDVPFDLLDKIFNDSIVNQPISYFLFAAFGIYLAIGASTALFKSLGKE